MHLADLRVPEQITLIVDNTTSRANVEVGGGTVALSVLVPLIMSRLRRLKIKATRRFHVTWYANNKRGGDEHGSG